MARRSLPRDETGASASVILGPGEVVWDRARNALRVGDGKTVGGGIVVENLAPAGTVSGFQMREALRLSGKVQSISDVMPADENDPVTVRWRGSARVSPGDPLASFIAATLSYNDAAMAALFAAAAAISG